MTDESANLIARVSGGDETAFREVVESYSPRVYSIAYQMVGNSDDARDITQEVFIKLNRSAGSFDSRYPFWTWLYRITVNMAIDFSRKTSRHKHVSIHSRAVEQSTVDGTADSGSRVEKAELMGAVAEIVSTLTPNQKKVFVLRDIQGFSVAEISEVMECRPSTVRVHLAKARNLIRDYLLQNYPEFHGVKSNEML